MDGDLEMQSWYAERGFRFSHRSIRCQGSGASGELADTLVAAEDVPFERLAAYDRRCFPAARERFLRAWLEQPDSLALAAVERDEMRGFGVARRCLEGAKVGPLFADDASVAGELFDGLATFAPGEPLCIDVPEVNAWARSLVARRGLHEVFACARMYDGPAPDIDESRIYGVTTFELG
jgi:hypothetical protein